MDPQMDPQMHPARLISGYPCSKRARQGPQMVRIGQKKFIDHKLTAKLEFTAWFEVNPTFGYRGISVLGKTSTKFVHSCVS